VAHGAAALHPVGVILAAITPLGAAFTAIPAIFVAPHTFTHPISATVIERFTALTLGAIPEVITAICTIVVAIFGSIARTLTAVGAVFLLFYPLFILIFALFPHGFAALFHFPAALFHPLAEGLLLFIGKLLEVLAHGLAVFTAAKVSPALAFMHGGAISARAVKITLGVCQRADGNGQKRGRSEHKIAEGHSHDLLRSNWNAQNKAFLLKAE
jgi:hypothetical protein